MQLVDPHPRLHRSFLAAYDELVEADEAYYARLHTWPAEGAFPGMDPTRESLESPEEFAAYCSFLLQQRAAAAPRPRAYVAFTELWLAGGPQLDEYLGRVSLRHELTEPLLE